MPAMPVIRKCENVTNIMLGRDYDYPEYIFKDLRAWRTERVYTMLGNYSGELIFLLLSIGRVMLLPM